MTTDDQIVGLCKFLDKKDDRLIRMNQALAACAYWAASGLHPTSNYSAHYLMLKNILKESKEYAESEPGRDSNIKYDGFVYSYTPVGGWPEPERKMM